MGSHSLSDSATDELTPHMKAHYYDVVPPLPSEFLILHQNVRSLRSDMTKLTLLQQLMNDCMCDAFAVTETWLHDSAASVTHVPGYNFVHSVADTTKTKGFGIGCFIKSTFSYEIIEKNYSLTQDEASAIEFLAIDVRSCSFDCVLLVVYRSPSTSCTYFLSALDSILLTLTAHDRQVVIAGDYNIDMAQTKDKITEGLHSLTSSYGLVPTIDIPTRVCTYRDKSGIPIRSSSSTIDNIFINSASIATSGVLRTDTSDHYTIFTMLHPRRILELPASQVKKTVPIRRITDLAIENFSNNVATLDWSPLYIIDNTDDAMIYFDQQIQSLYDYYFPLRRYVVSDDYAGKPPKNDKGWFSQELLDMSRHKYSLYKRFKLTNNTMDKNNYLSYKHQFEQECANARIKYFSNKFNNTDGDASALWAEINKCLGRKKRSSSNIHKICSENGGCAENDVEIANTLNNHFATIGSKLSSRLPDHAVDDIDKYMPSASYEGFNFSTVSAFELMHQAGQMRSNLSGFLVRCPSAILLKSIGFLAAPLSYIFNLTVSTSNFATVLKHAVVTPIYKTGERSNPNNYRPISVTRFISKLFESLCKSQIMAYLDRSNILSDHQYGFRRGRSCEMALLRLTNYVVKSVEARNFTVGIFIDIRKAFDCVPFPQLLRKLNKYGFSTAACSLIASFLCDRTQQTYANQVMSSYTEVGCGVPQGTVLGPVLFILYINDLLLYLDKHSTVSPIAFADDTSLLFSHNDVDSAIAIVNRELDLVADWFNVNRLTLNVDKTSYLLFKKPQSPKFLPSNSLMINGAALTEETNVKCLGVVLSANLSWQMHVEHLTKRLSYSLAVLYRLARCGVPRRSLIPVYKALFLPHINYCSLVWGSSGPSVLKPLQVLQNRAFRMMFGVPSRTTVAPLMYDLNEMTVFQRLRFNYMTFIHDTLYELRPNFLDVQFPQISEVHNHFTRASAAKSLFVNRVRTQIAQRFVSDHGLSLWNTLPIEIRNIRSPQQFRALCRQHLLSLP
jgi:hypothetical protein